MNKRSNQTGLRRTGADHRPLDPVTGERQGRDTRSWTATVELGRDPATGERRRQSRSFPTEGGALEWLHATAAAVDRDEYMPPSTTTLAQLLAQWLAAGAPGRKSRDSLKATSLEHYRYLAAHYIAPAIGAIKVTALTSKDIERFTAAMEKSGLSSRTIRRVRTVLSSCLSWAVRERHLARNVSEGVRQPRQQATRDTAERVWTAEQRRAFLASAEGDALHAAYYALAHTGMRRGEVCGLRWANVDLQAGRITIANNRTRTFVLGSEQKNKRETAGKLGRMMTVDGTPKTHKPRRIAISPDVVEVLRHHRQQQMQQWKEPIPTDVFLDWDGRPLRPDTLSYRFELAVKRSGQPYISLHSLRHTYATLLLQAGAPVQVVSSMLGHASVAVTLNVYRHVLPDEQELVARMNAEL